MRKLLAIIPALLIAGNLYAANITTDPSTFDTSIDTYTPVTNADTIETYHINGPMSAIINMQTVLGTGLKGSQATLSARLSQMLSQAGGIKSGTSFPTSPTPVDAQLFWRSDLKALYIYDGAFGQWQQIQIPATFVFSSPSIYTLALYHNLTAGRTITFPDATDTLVARNTTDTLTNKTLITPSISTILNSGTITLPTSTTTLVGRDTTDTLTNKILTSPVISTIVNTGTLTLPTITDTLVARTTTDTLTNKTLITPSISTILNSGTITLPTSTTTLVGRDTTDTLTNKTIDDATNALTVYETSITDGTILARVAANETITGTYAFQPSSGAPFTTNSTTKVTNLNADTLDGINSTGFEQIGALVRAYRSSTDQTISNSSEVNVAFNSESWDTGNNFTPSGSYYFTPPRTGHYMIMGQLYFTSPTVAGTYSARIYNSAAMVSKNDVVTASTTGVTVQFQDIISATQGDTITIKVWQNSGTTQYISAGDALTFINIREINRTL